METAKTAPTKRNVTSGPEPKKGRRTWKNPLTRVGDAGSLPAMKHVLSILVAFVFIQTQCWALSGGPRYGGNSASVAGTYAGVFTGVSGTARLLDPATNTLIDPVGSNALGLFVIGVGQVDIASGSLALFFEGTFFQGGLLGVADPNKQTLSATAQGIHKTEFTSYTSIFFGDSFQSAEYDARADGTIQAEFKEGTATSGLTLEGSGVFTVSVVTTDTITVPDPLNPGFFTTKPIQKTTPTGTLSFVVDGFKQSDEVIKPGAGSLAALLNNTGVAGTGQTVQ